MACMIYGVLALLDGLGTKVHKPEELERKISSFDKVDLKIKENVKKLVSKLGSRGYNSLLISGLIYDNIQIFLPVDLPVHGPVDLSGKNGLWWGLMSMGELLIDIFRYSLVNEIPLRGCITSGYGVINNSKRILGPIANEASRFYELADWVGVIASYHAEMVLNSKIQINPNPEIFEPFVKYTVPIKQNKSNVKLCNHKIVKTREPTYWALRWPLQTAPS